MPVLPGGAESRGRETYLFLTCDIHIYIYIYFAYTQVYALCACAIVCVDCLRVYKKYTSVRERTRFALIWIVTEQK